MSKDIENGELSNKEKLERIGKSFHSLDAYFQQNSQDDSPADKTKSDRAKEFFINRMQDVISEARDGINSAKERLADVRIDKKQVAIKTGKMIKEAMLASSNVKRSVSMTMSLVTLDPVGIVLDTVASSVGFGSDYLLTRDTIKQEKTYNNLIKHNNAKAEQESLRLQNPELFDALNKDLLYEPNKEGKKSATKQYKPKSKAKMMARATVPVVVESGIAAMHHTVSLITTANPLAAVLLAHDVGSGFVFIKNNYDTIKFNERTKQLSNSQMKSSLAPGFDNLQELNECTREQRIQTMALQKTIESVKEMGIKDFQGDNKELIDDIFQTHKKQVESQEKKVASSKTLFDRAKIVVKTTANNLKHTLNPASDYLHTERLEKKREKINIHLQAHDYHQVGSSMLKYEHNIHSVVNDIGKELPKDTLKELQDFVKDKVTPEVRGSLAIDQKKENLIKSSKDFDKKITELIEKEPDKISKDKLSYIKAYNNHHTRQLQNNYNGSTDLNTKDVRKDFEKFRDAKNKSKGVASEVKKEAIEIKKEMDMKGARRNSQPNINESEKNQAPEQRSRAFTR